MINRKTAEQALQMLLMQEKIWAPITRETLPQERFQLQDCPSSLPTALLPSTAAALPMWTTRQPALRPCL